METTDRVKGARDAREDLRPTYDQLYLAERINEASPNGQITIPAIQKLNRLYGVAPVTSAMRAFRGFPPEDLRTAYGYLSAILKGQA